MRYKYKTIQRKDLTKKSLTFNDIYDLSITKGNTQIETEIVLTTIKKMILCTDMNFIYSNKVMHQTFLMIHIILFFIITTFINSLENLLQYWDSIVIISLIILIPVYIYNYFFNIRFFPLIKSIQNNIATHILEVESQTNPYFDYTLLDNFSFTAVTKRNSALSSNNSSDRDKQYYCSYIVTVNISPEINKVIYNELIAECDKELIERVFKFINDELLKRLPVFARESIVPSFIMFVIFCIIGRHYSYFLVKCVFLIMTCIVIIMFTEMAFARNYKNTLEEFLSELNEEIIPEGKYVFRCRTLLFICNLNEKGKRCSERTLSIYFNKILNI
jgi:hypothetical protein